MKTRAILLISLVAAQLVWLVWLNFSASQELDRAPRVVIPAELVRHRTLVPRLTFNLKDSEQFGDSIWWGENLKDTPYRYADPAAGEQGPAPRPCPEGQQGTATELTQGDAKQQWLAIFWRRGEDGTWIPRIEISGSPQDTPREGEIRCTAQISFIATTTKDDVLAEATIHCRSNSLTLQQESYPRRQKYLSYPLSASTTNALKKLKYNAQRESIRYSIEIALREGKSPIVTQAFLNDVPEHEAANKMEVGSWK